MDNIEKLLDKISESFFARKRMEAAKKEFHKNRPAQMPAKERSAAK